MISKNFGVLIGCEKYFKQKWKICEKQKNIKGFFFDEIINQLKSNDEFQSIRLNLNRF